MGTSTGRVAASDGTLIAYRVAGDASDSDAPALLLIHGWAQSSKCWGDALVSDLAQRHRVITMDLRGHGESGVPDAEHLTADDFAGDVAAVLDAEVPAGQPVFLLGWSYGGLVIGDYLSRGPAANVAGLILVGAITSMGRGQAGGRVGPAMRAALPDAYADDPVPAVAAVMSFVEALVPPGQGALAQALLGATLAVPPHIRSGLFGRSAANDEVFAASGLPALLIHGTTDQVVDISCAEHAETLMPNASVRLWEGGGHAPFLEDPALFAEQVGGFLVESAVSGGVR